MKYGFLALLAFVVSFTFMVVLGKVFSYTVDGFAVFLGAAVVAAGVTGVAIANKDF